jgi:SAM-dependent methyltransferase
MLTGYWTSASIVAAAELGVADLLRDGPKTAAELAGPTGTHAPSLYRLLRALASVGIFVEDGQGRFAQTPLSEMLRSDVPGSQKALAIMMGTEHFRTWGDLMYSLRTGRNAFEHIYGRPVFQYLAQHPTAARNFDEAMVGVHGVETAAMLDVYDFNRFGVVVDVGGGNGSLLTVLLQRCPTVRGVLFDRPDVAEAAKPQVEKTGLANRCAVVPGDFFQTVPPGGDVYLMRHIIHEWNDEQSLTILRNCRKVTPPGGRLLLIECVILPGNEPHFGKFLDLNMLVIPGGKERTEAEYRDLYAQAGFRLERIYPTRADVSVIEGVPV